MYDVDPRDIPTLQRYIDGYCRAIIARHSAEVQDRLAVVRSELDGRLEQVDAGLVEMRKSADRLAQTEADLADVKVRLNWAEPRWIYHQARKWTVAAMVSGMALLLALFFTPLGPALGFPPQASSGSGATGSGVHEATRNLIAILGPILIGITIWVVTVVAERRLKAYDETIDKFRDTLKAASAKATADFNTLRDEVMLTRERTENRSTELFKVLNDALTISASNFKDQLANDGKRLESLVSQHSAESALVTSGFSADLEKKLEQVQRVADGLDERFGGIVGLRPWGRGASMSVGDIRHQVGDDFVRGASEAAVAAVLDLFNQAPPFRKV